MASNLFQLIDVAHRAISQMTEVADAFEGLAETINSTTATVKDHKDFWALCGHALSLQVFLDDLRTEFDGYIRLADNDLARLGLTDSKAKEVLDFMEAASVRPFAPLETLYQALGLATQPLIRNVSQSN